MKSKSYASGFTLVELMIVMAIIVVLAAVAVPMYQDNVVRTRRTDVQKTLLELENAMERYYTEQSPYSYEDATLGAAGIFPNQAPRDGAIKYYDLTIEEATANSYLLEATPIAGTTQEDDGPLQLESTGVKRWDRENNGFDDDVDDCWAASC